MNPRAPVDPRTKNSLFPAESIKAHVTGYADALAEGIRSVDWDQLERAVAVLESAAERRAQIWVAGNGGSAAIADHLVCDWLKGTHFDEHAPMRVQSLASNMALLSACANDLGFDRCFEIPLRIAGSPGDVLVVISSSGNSGNVVNALLAAKSIGIQTIAFTGFSGGECHRHADIGLHVSVSNYGIIEDCHQLLMHNIGQFICARRERRTAEQRAG